MPSPSKTNARAAIAIADSSVTIAMDNARVQSRGRKCVCNNHTALDNHHPFQPRSQPNHSCDVCNKCFTEKRALTRHYNSRGHRENVPGSQPITTFTCSACDKPFSRRDLRRRHEVEVHQKRKRKVRQRIDGPSNATPFKPSSPGPPKAIPLAGLGDQEYNDRGHSSAMANASMSVAADLIDPFLELEYDDAELDAIFGDYMHSPFAGLPAI